MTQIQLEIKIQEANKAYRAGNPIMTDAEYDALVEQLREIDPTNAWFQHIEPAQVIEGRKRKLPIPMKSLEKVKDLGDLSNWFKTCGLSEHDIIVIMPKFDGLSMLVDVRNQEAFTRGGSENEGQDCTAQYRYNDSSCVSGSSINCNYVFGEFVIRNHEWEQHFKGQLQESGEKYKSQRNTAAGLLNRDDVSDALNHTKLFVYGADAASMKNYESFSLFIHNICLNLNQEPLYEFVNVGQIIKQGQEALQQLYMKWRSVYPIDGLVLYVNDLRKWDALGRKNNGNPNYAIAYKHPDFTEVHDTTVQRIEWQVAKSGALKPVVVVDDVDNGDCIMNSPTGNNASWISDRNIAPGAVVSLTRSGGVIPKIVAVPKPATPESIYELWDEMAECPACGSPTAWNETHKELVCTNPECKGRQLAKIVFFYDILGAENFGYETLKKIFDHGLNTLHQILFADYAQLEGIDGFGDSTINNIIEQNRKIIAGVELPKLMHASDCFKNIGESTAKKMLDRYPSFIEAFCKPNLSLVFEGTLPAGENKTEQAFFDGLELFANFMVHNELTAIAPEAPKSTGNSLEDLSVCVSGFRDKALEEFILANGGKNASGVSKNTTHLVVKDKDSGSSKISKAKQLGIEILTLDEFKNKFNF